MHAVELQPTGQGPGGVPSQAPAEVHDPEVASDGRVKTYRQHDAPDEVVAVSEESVYKEYRALTDLREPFYIPAEYLVGTKKFVGLKHVHTTPLIVFINAKSGGRVGPRLASVLFHALGQGQVFDLADSRPAPVLHTLWANLLAREAAGDKRAVHIRRNLRILAAGGDGTVTWILQTIHELKLEPLPSVGVMPLGTGNDLSLSFGWGNMFLNKWIKSEHLYRTLKRFADAEVRPLDAWRITIASPTACLFHQLPHSLQLSASGGGSDPAQVTGYFWNYFSLGLDAAAAYGFHRLRENSPWAASTRLLNQMWYSYYSCSSGWFCGAAPLVNKLRLRVRDQRGAPWREVPVPRSIRALVLLNLQSYGGGRDIWGLSDNRPMKGKAFSDPIFDDGLIEVVGLGSGWHAALVMGQINSRLHAVRLAQCAEVDLELASSGGPGVKGEPGETHMQLDGEPWAQQLPAAGQGQPLRVNISCAFQSAMLFNNTDIQGGVRVKRIAQRGAERGPSTVSSASLASGAAGASNLTAASVPAGVSVRSERAAAIMAAGVSGRSEGSAVAVRAAGVTGRSEGAVAVAGGGVSEAGGEGVGEAWAEGGSGQPSMRTERGSDAPNGNVLPEDEVVSEGQS